MNSLHSLSPAELQALGSHQLGSHALQALVTTCSDKGKGKILRKMEVWLLHCVLKMPQIHYLTSLQDHISILSGYLEDVWLHAVLRCISDTSAKNRPTQNNKKKSYHYEVECEGNVLWVQCGEKQFYVIILLGPQGGPTHSVGWKSPTSEWGMSLQYWWYSSRTPLSAGHICPAGLL